MSEQPDRPPTVSEFLAELEPFLRLAFRVAVLALLYVIWLKADRIWATIPDDRSVVSAVERVERRLTALSETVDRKIADDSRAEMGRLGLRVPPPPPPIAIPTPPPDGYPPIIQPIR